MIHFLGYGTNSLGMKEQKGTTNNHVYFVVSGKLLVCKFLDLSGIVPQGTISQIKERLGLGSGIIVPNMQK